jgi:hypothetical protein
LKKTSVKNIISFLQEKFDYKKWLAPLKNWDLKGISFPCVLVWSWTEAEDREMVPSFSWKCHM